MLTASPPVAARASCLLKIHYLRDMVVHISMFPAEHK